MSACAGREHGFGLLEAVDAAGGNHRRGEPFLTHSGADLGGGLEIAAERALRIGVVRGHALVAAAARVGVGGFAYLGLFRIVEFAAARQRQISPCRRVRIRIRRRPHRGHRSRPRCTRPPGIGSRQRSRAPTSARTRAIDFERKPYAIGERRRRSRHRACSSARGTRPWCRRARSAVRRRRSRLRGRVGRRWRTGAGRLRRQIANVRPNAVSVTRSREPNSSASSSRASRIPRESLRRAAKTARRALRRPWRRHGRRRFGGAA